MRRRFLVGELLDKIIEEMMCMFLYIFFVCIVYVMHFHFSSLLKFHILIRFRILIRPLFSNLKSENP